jgi:hypothetical protein
MLFTIRRTLTLIINKLLITAPTYDPLSMTVLGRLLDSIMPHAQRIIHYRTLFLKPPLIW